ncbi:13080_t:CDS:2, partial [Dentiscutata erythropus]
LKKLQQVTRSVCYLPTQGSLNSLDSSSSGSPVCHPLQEIKQQNNTKAKFLEKKKYLYKIFRLGHYPQNIKQTQRSYHLIPNGYIVGVKICGTDLIAETWYDISDKVVYTITWGSKEKKKSVTSDKSAKFIHNNKTTFSGVVLFGFDLECLENRQINNQDQIRKNKPFHQLNSEAQKNIRLKALAYDINTYRVKYQWITGQITKFKFRKIKATKTFRFNYCTCDESLISRDGYRRLAAIIPEMEREYKVDENRQEITGIMDDIILVHL